MLAIIEAAGWPIWTIILASVIALAIIGERLWSLRGSLVAPADLLPQVVQEMKNGVTPATIERLSDPKKSPLIGGIFAAGLRNANSSREVMKEAIEEAGRGAAHELERFLNTLGTIIGMIEIFSALTPNNADPAKLAHGISVALYNTAMGLVVAIPCMVFYRYFRGKVDALVLEMELQAIKLVEIVHGERK